MAGSPSTKRRRKRKREKEDHRPFGFGGEKNRAGYQGHVRAGPVHRRREKKKKGEKAKSLRFVRDLDYRMKQVERKEGERKERGDCDEGIVAQPKKQGTGMTIYPRLLIKRKKKGKGESRSHIADELGGGRKHTSTP